MTYKPHSSVTVNPISRYDSFFSLAQIGYSLPEKPSEDLS